MTSSSSSSSKLHDLLVTGISTQFPDYNPNISSTNQQSNGYSFDPHCSECIRELWGPLLSPFAYLIKQNTKYFDEAIKRIEHNKSYTATNPSSTHSLKSLELEHDDHKFLTKFDIFAFRTSKIGWLINWTIGFLLMMLGVAIVALKDSQLPPLIVLLRMNQASRWGLKITLHLCFIIIILIGILKMLVSLFSLIAITHRIQSLMMGTLAFISVLILFEVGAFIYCAITRSELMTDINTALTRSFEDHYATSDNDRITGAWDRVFQSYQCCGWLVSSFSNSHWTAPTTNSVPHSCCRPGAIHPACESTLIPSTENYADKECSSSIQQYIESNAHVPITFSTIGFFILVEIASTVLTLSYATNLKAANNRRHYHNEGLMNKIQGQLSTYNDDVSNNISSDQNQILVRPEKNEKEDYYQLPYQHTTSHKNPPDIDSSFMSLTPTVVQVKRPDVYSYFYYE